MKGLILEGVLRRGPTVAAPREQFHPEWRVCRNREASGGGGIARVITK